MLLIKAETAVYGCWTFGFTFIIFVGNKILSQSTIIALVHTFVA